MRVAPKVCGRAVRALVAVAMLGPVLALSTASPAEADVPASCPGNDAVRLDTFPADRDLRLEKVTHTTCIRHYVENDTTVPIGGTEPILTAPPTNPGDNAINELERVVIPEGHPIEVHLLHFDRVGSATIANAEGTVAFDDQIIGLAVTEAQLNATDQYGVAGATYEPVGSRAVESGDFVYVESDHLLRVRLQVSAGMDELRVFTSPEPLPPVPVPCDPPGPSGAVVEHPPVPTVANGGLSSDECIFQIPELGPVTLAANLTVTKPTIGVDLTGNGATSVTLIDGTVVYSHLLHFDPRDNQQHHVEGIAEFDGPILGVILGGTQLGNTNTLLGRPPVPGQPGVTMAYGTAASRPVESGDVVRVVDPHHLELEMNASSDIDEVRVLTGSPGVDCVAPSPTNAIVTGQTLPRDLTLGALESDRCMYLFQENTVTVGPGGLGVVPLNGNPSTIPAGTSVTSYLLHADQIGSGEIITLPGRHVFPDEILGVIRSDAALRDTDALFALGSLDDYERDPGVTRGWDVDDGISLENPQTLLATSRMSGAGMDELRVIIGALPAGSVTFVKETAPAGAADVFQITGPPGGSVSTGSPLELVVAPGVHRFREAVVPGWRLTDVACGDDGGWESDGTITVVVESGEDVVCTLRNTRTGTIEIRKQADPADPDVTFGFSGVLPTDLATGESDTIEVLPGTYVEREDAHPGWELTGVSCTGGSTPSGQVPGERAASITVRSGEHVICTFTNEQLGKITIEKQTQPDGSAQQFTFTGAIGALLRDDEHASGDVEAGIYEVVELATDGWDLTSITCDDDDSGPGSTPGAARFEVAAGEHVRCTFENTKRTSLTVRKVLSGSRSQPQLFDFSGAVTGSIPIDGSLSASVTPGVLSVTEAPVAGWRLESIACDNGLFVQTDLETRTVQLLAPLGAEITCTFANRMVETVTEFEGPHHGRRHVPVEVHASLHEQLADGTAGAAIAGAPLTITLNSTESCTGTTDGEGWASCTITPAEPRGVYPILASYAGSDEWPASSDEELFAVVEPESTGRSLGASVQALLVPFASYADTGDVRTAETGTFGGTWSKTGVGGLAVSLAESEVATQPGRSDATSDVASVKLSGLTVPSVKVVGASAESHSACGVESTGSATVASITIGLVTYRLPASWYPPNFALELPIPGFGTARIVLNEQEPFEVADGHGLTVRALHIEVPGLLDLVVGEATSDIHHCDPPWWIPDLDPLP